MRGSTSHYIASDVLAELGAIHYGRKKVQPRRHELLRYFDLAHPRLNYAPVTFDARAFELIAGGFHKAITQNNYTCYACAVMPDHVHLVIRKHKQLSEEMISHLQRESHIELRDKGWIDMEHPRLGRARVDGLSRSSGRHFTVDQVRAGQSTPAQTSGSGMGFHHSLQQLAPPRGTQSQLTVCTSDS